MMMLATVVVALAALAGRAAAARCPDGFFECGEGPPCIWASDKCNGRRDCADGSDETAAACAVACPKDQFRCDSGQCLYYWDKCNRKDDCSDGSDETPAACARACPAEFFRCDSGECVFASLKCNGEADCGDGSDETASGCASACQPGYFRCDDGSCIVRAAQCDGSATCGDASDERPAACPHVLSTSLAPGESATVRVAFPRNWRDVNDALIVLVCNATECGKLKASRGSDWAAGDLTFHWYTGCGWPLWDQCRVAGPARFARSLPPGNYSLVLERRAAQLAVWREGRPDSVALVDAPDGGLAVVVRPCVYEDAFRAELEEGPAHRPAAGQKTTALQQDSPAPLQDAPAQGGHQDAQVESLQQDVPGPQQDAPAPRQDDPAPQQDAQAQAPQQPASGRIEAPAEAARPKRDSYR